MDIFHTAKKIVDEFSTKRKLRRFLVQDACERGEPWRNKEALKKTIHDVLSLDEDLKEYVIGFLNNRACTGTMPGCEVISIDQLIQSGEFSPVTAALYIQWYRRDPKNAAAFLLQRDTIVGLPALKEDQICDPEDADDGTADVPEK